jgi:hypothetical protein
VRLLVEILQPFKGRDTLRRYHNRAVDSFQVIEELIALAKDHADMLAERVVTPRLPVVGYVHPFDWATDGKIR